MTHVKKYLTAGLPLEQAKKVLIMLHGRGADAEDILGLAAHLQVEQFALIAPQATGNTWYPNSFLAPPAQNEPWLGSALDVIGEIVEEIKSSGFPEKDIYFLGFSQGACLSLEYISRNAKRYGGAVIFTGGLIGDKLYPEKYQGDFEGTPVFIGTSDPDPHVPVARVESSVSILKSLNADVKLNIYKQMGHTIITDEISNANNWVLNR